MLETEVKLMQKLTTALYKMEDRKRMEEAKPTRQLDSTRPIGTGYTTKRSVHSRIQSSDTR